MSESFSAPSNSGGSNPRRLPHSLLAQPSPEGAPYSRGSHPGTSPHVPLISDRATGTDFSSAVLTKRTFPLFPMGYGTISAHPLLKSPKINTDVFVWRCVRPKQELTVSTSEGETERTEKGQTKTSALSPPLYISPEHWSPT